MRMMKTNKNETIMVSGIDHGYGNMKTATLLKMHIFLNESCDCCSLRSQQLGQNPLLAVNCQECYIIRNICRTVQLYQK